MAFQCIKFLEQHFDIKFASADYFHNEVSKQKHQPNKRPALDDTWRAPAQATAHISKHFLKFTLKFSDSNLDS